MGAAVWPGSVASNAMRRRVRGALASARDVNHAIFLVSGGIGRNPPSEARVMADLLHQAGVAEQDIILEQASSDTFSSVRNCARILHSLGAFQRIVVCSDTYHIPRCRWLFYLYGVSTEAGWVESGRPENSTLRWLYYQVREIPAFLYDTVVVVFSRFGSGSAGKIAAQ